MWYCTFSSMWVPRHKPIIATRCNLTCCCSYVKLQFISISLAEEQRTLGVCTFKSLVTHMHSHTHSPTPTHCTILPKLVLAFDVIFLVVSPRTLNSLYYCWQSPISLYTALAKSSVLNYSTWGIQSHWRFGLSCV